MEFATVADELYGLPPREFTATRDARASEARQAGDGDLATSLKQLRKPSVGAWMANRLVREQGAAIERLVRLGRTLRSAGNPDGERIRTASKEKQDTIAKLLRQARSIAQRAGQAVSQAAEQDLEATLDAAFGDEQSAVALLEGRLAGGLRYSGLGFGAGARNATTPTRSTPSGRGKGGPAGSDTSRATRTLEQARLEAERADAKVEKAERAIRAAEADIQRLRAALSVAVRQAKKAHEKATSAQKRVEAIR